MSYEQIRFTAVEEIRSVISQVDAAEVGRLATAIRAASGVFVAGAGRSGLAMRGFAMRLMHMRIPAYVVGDATTPALTPGEILVVGSGSGKHVQPGCRCGAGQKARRRGCPFDH